MAFPNYTYKYRGAWQSVKGAERPHCAMVRVLHALRWHQKVGGDARGELEIVAHATARDSLDAQGFNPVNICHWVDGLDGTRIGACNYMAIDTLALSDYQMDAVANLTVAGGVMAMGCGLGKTITALSAALEIISSQQDGPGRLFIACPLNAIPAWKEYEAWMLSTGWISEYEIISVDSMHKLKGLDHHANSVIIFDEVHMLGNTTARRTKAAHDLRKAFTAGICLTGTLLHGGLEKVLSILDLAIPGAAGFSNKWNCGKYFKCIIQKPMGARVVRELAKPSQEHLTDFNEWLANYCQLLNKDSTTVRQEVDLPAQIVHDLEFPNDESIDDAAVRIAEQIYQDTGIAPHMQEVAHRLSRDGLEEKLGWLGGMMRGAREPVVIFATYHETLDAIECLFNQVGAAYTRVDGSVTGKQRSACLDDFQRGRVQYFLAQTDAASVSMNLQHSHISVMFDASWKAANYDQALARTCRRGRTTVCHHFNLIGNKFQAMVWKRVQAAMNFDASVAEWQATKASIDAAIAGHP